MRKKVCKKMTTKKIGECKGYLQCIMRIMKNSGLPKPENGYGDGGPIVPLRKHAIRVRPNGGEVQQRYYSSKCEAANYGHKSLEQQLNYDENGKCINAYKLTMSIENLLVSYGKIKSKPSNMTPGVGKETFDGISIKYFENLQKKLQNESWQPKPSKKIYIDKAHGKKRPLGIPTLRDKIVQTSMLFLLEKVLEVKFLECSTGFRAGKGCHTALGKIRYWNGIKWFIEGDIKNFFDEIDHQILESLLKNHFNDQRFLDLYWKMVKAGYIENGKKKISDKGTPQGSMRSPILSNLYLHELDIFIENERKFLESKFKKTNKPNPDYNKIDNRIQNITKQERILKAIGEKIKSSQKEERQKLLRLRRKTKSTIPVPETARIYYVRYADDWLIGFRSTYKYAAELKKRIGAFLKEGLKLTLSEEKTYITDTDRKKPANFLSTNIT